jgi:hypothetical protein
MTRLRDSLRISTTGPAGAGKPGDVVKAGTRRIIRTPANGKAAAPVPFKSASPSAHPSALKAAPLKTHLKSPLKAARRPTRVVTVRRPEELIQRSVVNLLSIYQSRGLLAFCHVPNGGRRSKAEAGTFKAMGVRAGVPDLLIWAQGGGHFAIELKAETGRLSPAQADWHATMANLGHRVYVCRSIEDVENSLRAEAVPPIGKLAKAKVKASV